MALHEPGVLDHARDVEHQAQAIALGELARGAQDPKSNTGGLLATDNPADNEHFMNEVVLYEGLHTYGGMAGRTMEVFARGLSEMCAEDEEREGRPLEAAAAEDRGEKRLR